MRALKEKAPVQIAVHEDTGIAYIAFYDAKWVAMWSSDADLISFTTKLVKRSGAKSHCARLLIADRYNHLMNGVDRVDQNVGNCNVDGKLRYRKLWWPIDNRLTDLKMVSASPSRS